MLAPPAAARGLSSRVAAQGLDDQTIAGYAQSVELAAVAAYTAAAPVLPPATLPVAQLFVGHHQAARRRVRCGRRRQGGDRPNAELVAAVDADPRGDHRRDRCARVRVRAREPGGLHLRRRADAAAGPGLLRGDGDDPADRGPAPVVLGLALGKPVDDVFPTGAFESAALGDGTDPLAGLDPAVFPA